MTNIIEGVTALSSTPVMMTFYLNYQLPTKV